MPRGKRRPENGSRNRFGFSPGRYLELTRLLEKHSGDKGRVRSEFLARHPGALEKSVRDVLRQFTEREEPRETLRWIISQKREIRDRRSKPGPWNLEMAKSPANIQYYMLMEMRLNPGISNERVLANLRTLGLHDESAGYQIMITPLRKEAIAKGVEGIRAQSATPKLTLERREELLEMRTNEMKKIRGILEQMVAERDRISSDPKKNRSREKLDGEISSIATKLRRVVPVLQGEKAQIMKLRGMGETREAPATGRMIKPGIGKPRETPKLMLLDTQRKAGKPSNK